MARFINWTIKDFVFLALAIIGILFAVYYGQKSSNQEGKLNEIGTIVKEIKQSPYFQATPPTVKSQILIIENISGDVSVSN